jgi:hypothetical protein
MKALLSKAPDSASVVKGHEKAGLNPYPRTPF